MESSDGVGHYEGGGGGGALDNDFESLSAEGTDDFHGLSSSSFEYHPEKLDFEASAGGGSSSGGVQGHQHSPSDPPEQLISFDGVEDVVKQPDATPPPQKNWSPLVTSTIKDASGPTEMGLSGTTDDDKKCSSCAPCKISCSLCPAFRPICSFNSTLGN